MTIERPTNARLTLLVDNTVVHHETKAEHGLAIWLEAGLDHLLFDTGQSDLLMTNARRLGVRPESADAVVLSHGHYDHTGALPNILRAALRPTLYVHPAAFEPKWAVREGQDPVNIGLTSITRENIDELAETTVPTTQPTEVLPGVWVTGEIPRITEFEDVGGPFFRDREGTNPDPMHDDQAMFFPSEDGTVVVVGCTHAGLINTLFYIRDLTDGRPIHTVIGGLHLVKPTRHRMARTIEALQLLQVKRLGAMHCTGAAARAELWKALPGVCFECGVGTRLEFTMPRAVVKE